MKNTIFIQDLRQFHFSITERLCALVNYLEYVLITKLRIQSCKEGLTGKLNECLTNALETFCFHDNLILTIMFFQIWNFPVFNENIELSFNEFYI